MAILTKNQLSASNASSFPDNTTGAITPQILRDYNTNIIDSMVDSLNTGSYAILTGSNDFTQQNNFTSISASSFVSASEFVGDGSKITGITASVALPILDEGILQGYATSINFTGSAINAQVIAGTAVVSVNVEGAGFVSTSSFNAYTASNDSKVNSLISATGSYAISSSVAAVDAAQQAQINSLIAQTGSNANTSLNAFTASQETKDSTLATYTASVDTKFSNIGAQSSSWDNTILNQFTASQLTKDATLATYTASVDQKFSNIGAQSGSWITESESGSFLVTASVNLNTITFTKGDASTFNITVNTGSGGGGGTADLTSLNQFTASQETKNATLASVTASLQQQLTNIGTQSGSWVTSAITASSIITASVSNDDITFTKGDGSQFTIQVATGSYALSASYAETASLAQSALDIIVTAKNTTGAQLNKGTVVRIVGANGDNPLIGTASWTDDDNSANTLGFVTADIPNDSFGRVITQGTLLGINTDPALGYAAGQLLYLSASGQYTNVKPPVPYHEVRLGQVLRAQQNNGSIYVLIQNGYELTELHDVDINTGSLANKDLLAYNSATGQWENESIGTLGLATTGSNTFDGNQIISGGLTLSGSLGITYVEGGAEVVQQVTALGNYQTLYDGGILFQTDGINNYEQTIPTTFSKGVTINSGSTFNDGVTITGGLTGSLQQGYAWVGNVAGVSVPVPTSSFAGATINTGSFATTGSNVFTGDQTLIDAAGNSVTLSDVSGSLMLVAKTFTSASTHLTSSANSFTNLIFKNNNNTADTIISGSNNLFVNPAAPTAGFKRFVGTTGNIELNASNVPQISSSMAYPITMNNNILTSNGTTITMRGPVSSSTWTIAGNVIGGTVNIGTAAATHAQSLVAGFNMNQNVIPGTLSIIAAQTGVNFNQTTAVSANYIAGGATLNLSGSGIGFNNNIVNDAGTSIVNGYYSSSIGLGQLAVNRNNFAGQNQTMFVSGAFPAGGGGAPSYSDNAMFGGNNTIFTNVSAAPISGGFTLHSAIRNLVAGHQLIMTGSSNVGLADTYGSAFVGRWNANDGVRNTTGQNVFVVGTGKNDTTRKTGFLIDSGSNTFIEGTLNVSGSSSYTGSVYGNVVSMSVTSNTASMNLALGNYFELTSSASPLRIELSNIKGGQTATLILSASVSSSIAFSSNVGQPSPGAYSGSVTASVDILSFVAFNNTKANLVATKNIV